MLPPNRAGNIFGLMFGYLLGQGSILVTTAILISTGRTHDATNYGLAIAYLSLIIHFADFGGTTLLSRLQSRKLEAKIQTINLVRIPIAAIIVAALLLTPTDTLMLDSMGETILTFAAPGIFLWSINQIGRIDGLSRSGVSGLVLAPPWTLPSLVALMPHWSEQGAWVGSAFSVGIFVSLLLQLIVLRRIAKNVSVLILNASWNDIRSCFCEASAILLATLPGQLTGRLHMYLAVAFLAPDQSAAFIFARNTLNAANNVVYMARRIEFPALVAKIGAGLSIMGALRLQLFSFGLTVPIVLFLFCAAGVPRLMNDHQWLDNLKIALEFSAIFSLVLPITALSGALLHILFARGEASKALLPSYLLLLTSVGLAVPGIMYFSTLGLWAATIISNLATIPFYWFALGRRQPGS